MLSNLPDNRYVYIYIYYNIYISYILYTYLFIVVLHPCTMSVRWDVPMLTEMMLVMFCYVENAGSRARDASCGAQLLVSAVGDNHSNSTEGVKMVCWDSLLDSGDERLGIPVLASWQFIFGSGLMPWRHDQFLPHSYRCTERRVWNLHES